MFRSDILRAFGLFALMATLAACNETRFTSAAGTPSYGPVELVLLDNATVSYFAAPPRAGADGLAFARSGQSLPQGRGGYLVGAGDQISITVWEYPELTTPGSEDGGGLTVMQDGRLYFPYVGYIQAAGRTPGQIRDRLAAGLANFLPDPQVDVRVTNFASQRVVVSGAVAQPGAFVIGDTGLTALEAILLAGGPAEGGDLSRVTIERGGQIYAFDLSGPEQGLPVPVNPALRSGDIVSIVAYEPRQAYLFGEVGRVGEIDLTARTMSLTQALAQSGGLDQRRADVSGVFLFRRVGNVTRVGQLDLTSPVGYLVGERTDVAEGDVIYVTTAPVTRWNDLISQLLPSLGATRAVTGTAGVLTGN
ncbi:polysaccharide biosynthesis/export family protein [Roseobacter sp. HKCCA0434]|uniref:polysaccharide biosynthesis/export family protein n=1 Tax=Roseobacter sp. HKCCA0434 TaxID=3079297 RepID=UPI002905F4A4|nr:polysaccharide biosynthesis/export family protein [Roseobacter sp. HKCCA0434]